jgi:hypothetical protein
VDLGELRALIALLRENGVTSYSAGGVSLTLGSAEIAQPAEGADAPVEPSLDQVKQAALDLLMQSSGSAVRLVPRKESPQ